MKAHHHPFHELIIILKGCMEVRIEGAVHRVQAGDLLLYLAGQVHEEIGDPKNPVESYFLSIQFKAAASLPLRSHDRGGRVRQLGEWIYADRSVVSEVSRKARAALVAGLVAELVRLKAHPAEDAALFRTTKAYIHAHLPAVITLDDLARQAGLSKFHFSRVYRKLTGCTPMETVREIRLNHARHLLLTTNLPVKQIAPLAGIGDEYQLSHLIRKHHQMTPGQLRRQSRLP